MPFAAILIGAILVIVAINKSYPQLASELETDLPGFAVWGAAIAAIVALGFIPGIRTPSRWLLALVLIVLLVRNYTGIFAGFANFAQSLQAPGSQSGGTTSTTTSPAATTSTSPAATSTGTGNVAPVTQASPLDPNAYLAAFSGFGGSATA